MSWISENSLTWIQYLALQVLKAGKIPKHVAFIMDGNRRFAKKNDIKKIQGHEEGFNKLADTLSWCSELGIKEVTVYCFSIENFKRSPEEVNSLLDLAREKFIKLLSEKDRLEEHGVRIRVIGNLTLLPKDLVDLMDKSMEMTKNHKEAYLNLAFAYTARDEICSAINSIVDGVSEGALTVDEISEELLSSCLYTDPSPYPELLIRTSGEVRLSDYLLWQTSSSYLHFTPVLWPEFSVWHLCYAIFQFQRNYNELEDLRKTTVSCSALSNNLVQFQEHVKQERNLLYGISS